MKKLTAALAIFSFVMLALSFVSATPSLAISPCTGSDTAICATSKNTLTGPDGILTKVISILLYIAGTIAVIMIVIGAIRYITSDGDSSKASQAKNTIIYAVVGLIVAVMSFGIVSFVLGRL